MSMQSITATCLGESNARDAVYLDSLTQDGNSLVFSGEINGELCSLATREWISYTLSFSDVSGYDCRSIDSCDWELASNFSVVERSTWLEELRDDEPHKEFLLATYDFVYRISATGFAFVELGRRPFGSASPGTSHRSAR